MWKNCLISDLGNVVGGATPPTSNSNNYDGDIPWITPKDLSNHNERYIIRGERNITDQGYKNCSAQMLPKGSVLFSSRAPIGYVAIAANEVCTNQGFKSIAPNYNTDSLFLYYLLIYNRSRIESMGSGTTFKEVSGAVMKQISIKVPTDIQEQQAIASVLGALDDKIELNNRINANLEAQAQAIFDSYFKNILDGNSFVGDYIKPKRGKNLLSKDAIKGSVPVIAGGLFPATYHNISNTTAPVITISASGANAGFVNIWHIPVWSSDSSFIDSRMTSYIYFWYLLLKKRQKEIFDSQTGSAQPHIYAQHIERIRIPELNVSDIKKYNDNVELLFQKIWNNIEQSRALSSLRDTLLPKLMSGEIRINYEGKP